MEIEGVDFAQLAMEPISEASPCGEDISYDEQLDWLEAEFKKLTNPVLVPLDEPAAEEKKSGKKKGPASKFVYEEIDWEEVSDTCRQILVNKSKELRVAAYWARSLTEEHGLPGMSGVLRYHRALLETHWEGLFPVLKRMSFRARVLTSMRDHLLDCLENKQKPLVATAEMRPQLETALGDLEFLETYLGEKMGGKAPAFSILKNKLAARMREAAPPPAPEPPPAETPAPADTAEPATESAPAEPVPSPTQPSAAPAPGPVAAPAAPAGIKFEKPGDVAAYLESLKPTATALATWAASNAPQDPFPFRWVRMILWGNVQMAPEATMLPLPPPPEQAVTAIAGMYAGDQWADLLKTAELQFTHYPLWLDLQRYAVEALTHLGEDYDEARAAVQIELSFFLQRNPGLPSLLLQNDFPVATEETRTWLEAVGSDVPAAASGTQKDSSTAAGDGAGLEFDSGLDTSENLKRAQQVLRSVHGKRHEFLLRLKLAEWCWTQEQFSLSFGMAEELDRLIRAHRLESWEPELVISALKVLHRSAAKMATIWTGQAPGLAARSQEALTRMATLDPVAAMQLGRTTS